MASFLIPYEYPILLPSITLYARPFKGALPEAFATEAAGAVKAKSSASSFFPRPKADRVSPRGLDRTQRGEVADGDGLGVGGDASGQATEHFARAYLDEPRDSLTRHELDRVLPVNAAAELAG
jgi:hypothetical protein